MLANLLSNAGKHTPADSTVSVALAPVTATPPALTAGDTAVVQRGTVPAGPSVELSITDDGPGISPELLPEPPAPEPPTPEPPPSEAPPSEAPPSRTPASWSLAASRSGTWASASPSRSTRVLSASAS